MTDLPPCLAHPPHGTTFRARVGILGFVCALLFPVVSYAQTSPDEPGASSSVRQKELLQTYGTGLISLIRDMKMSSFYATDESKAPYTGTLLDKEAVEAFSQGFQGMANELMYGHMATEFPESTSELQKVRFNSMLKRPVWNVRWGVSISVRGDLSDPSPIREGATQPGANLQQPSNDGGESMEQAMRDQEALLQAQMELAMTSTTFGQQERPARRRMLDPQADGTLDSNIGLVATVCAEELDKRFLRGDFGLLFTSVKPSDPDEVVGNEQASSETLTQPFFEMIGEAPNPVPMWKPAIAFLGSGESAEKLKEAKKAEIDFLLHYDVTVKLDRNDKAQNITRCRLFSVSNGKSIALSKGIDSLEAAQLVSRKKVGDEREYVNDQLETLWNLVDRDTKCSTMPSLTADQAKLRISTLVSTGQPKSLKVLAEIRYYHAQKLIDDAQLESAFDIIGGDEAMTMLYGVDDERRAIVRKWALDWEEKKE